MGAPRIHGELLMLGIEVGQSPVAKYMGRRVRPTSQSRKSFLRNHAADPASIDLFVVPTVSFKLLYGLVKAYASYYNRLRLSLCKDAPPFRRRQTLGQIVSIPVFGVGSIINTFGSKFSVTTGLP